jgi:hypothetical protein
VLPVSTAEVSAIVGRRIDWPMITYAGLYYPRRGKPKLIAYGGLAWRFAKEDGTPRCDIWFDVHDRKLMARLNRGLTLVRWAKRMLRTAAQFGDREVYCLRDEEPNSAKLLRLAGLELMDGAVSIAFDDGTTRTGELWRWQA